MRIGKSLLGVIGLWCAYLGYLLFMDPPAFWVSLVLTPPFGTVAWLAMKSDNLILKIFLLFAFIAHAVGAPYLWLNREKYSYFGSGAVKDFNFDLANFFVIYSWVFSLFFLVAVFTIIFDRLRLGRVNSKTNRTLLLRARLWAGRASARATERRNGGIFVFLVIVLFAVPLNIYMLHHRIGITGLLSEPLPFRLVGIMYFSRLCFLPLLLTWLYFKSSRGWLLSSAIGAYGLFAGVSAASRTVLLLSLMPVIFDVLLSRQRMKTLILGLFVGVSFVIVGVSREYTYATQELSYHDMAVAIFDTESSSSRFNLMNIIGGFSNRLYGAQDMILSYQYEPRDPFPAFVRYFCSGGRADAVVPDLGRDFYGVDYEGTGLGVGLGTMAYLLMLGRANIILWALGPALIALLLSLGNRCLNWVAGHNPGTPDSPIMYFAAVLLSFSIYSSSLNLYYLIAEGMMVLGLLTGLARSISVRHAPRALYPDRGSVH